MELRRFTVGTLLAEILALLALGVVLGTVQFSFGGFDVEVVATLVFVGLVGGIVGLTTAIVAKREEVEAGVRTVVDRPAPLVGALVLAVVGVGLLGVAFALLGQNLVALAVGGAVTGAVVGGLAWVDVRVAVERPILVLGAFAGGLVAVFAAGVVLGTAGVVIGPILVALLLAGSILGGAAAVAAKRDTVKQGVQVAVENPAPIAGGLVTALLYTVTFAAGVGLLGNDPVRIAIAAGVAAIPVAIVVWQGADAPIRRPLLPLGGVVLAFVVLLVAGSTFGWTGFSFGGVGIVAGPIVLFMILVGGLVGGAYGAIWWLRRPDEEPEDAGEAGS